VQSVFGGLIAYDAGMKLFGGEAQAKALWKYHRLSGYLLITLMLFTASTAVSSADWVVNNSSLASRNIMVIGLILAFTGIVARIRYVTSHRQSKLL